MLKSKKTELRLLSLGDQIFFSVANFILTIILAKYYSDEAVAGYGIGLSIALILQNSLRSCYVVQNSVLAAPIFRKRAPKVLGQHLIMWSVILSIEFIVCLALLFLHPSPLYESMIFGTLICSLIYAQLDFDRIVLIKHDKVIDPFLASFAFALLIGALFFVIPRFDIPFEWTMGLIATYAGFKMIRLFFLVGAPDFFWGWRLMKRDMKKNLPASLLGVAGFSGYNHIPLMILSHVAAPIHAAVFVALRGLMQPIQVVIRSLDVIDKNIASGNGKTHAALRHTLFRQMIIYAGLSITSILGALLLGPLIIHIVYGEKYENFNFVLTGWAIIFSFLAVTYPLETVIVKLNRLTIYNTWRLLAGATGLLLAAILCPTMGVAGAMIACLSGWIVSMLSTIWVIRDVFYPSKE